MNPCYMLDTNVVSHIMQGRDAALLARLVELPVSQVVISSVTLAELEYGLHRKGKPIRLRNALAQLLLRIDVLPWDARVATQYGELCADLYPSHLKTPAWERAAGRSAALQSLAGGAAPTSFCALPDIPADAPPNSVYPSVRGIEAQGINLSDFDMMIAAHAIAVDATLISRDKAFARVPQRLTLQVW